MSQPSPLHVAVEPTSRAPARVRELTKQWILHAVDSRPLGDLIDDVALVVTELLTNSIQAHADTIELDVRRTRNDIVVSVSVSDNGQGWPTPRQATEHETSGRGLQIVAALAARWGASSEVGRTVVWAEMLIPLSPR